MKLNFTLLIIISFSSPFFSQEKLYENDKPDTINEVQKFVRELTDDNHKMNYGNFTLDSAVISKVDGTKEKHIYSHDNQGNRTLWLKSDYNGSQWNNSTQNTYEYDSFNNLLTETKENWLNNQWTNVLRDNYNYNISNQKTLWLVEGWNIDHWENVSRNSYEYDSTFNLFFELHEEWRNNLWENSLRIYYTYNEPGNNIALMKFEGWDADSSKWNNFKRYIFLYDSLNQLINFTWEVWSPLGYWDNSHRTSYGYNSAGKMTLLYDEYWNGLQWINNGLITYDYDFNLNLISRIYQRWDGSQWYNYNKYTYTYTPSNKLETFLYELWNNAQWEKLYRTTYNYDPDDNMNYAFNEDYLNGNWNPSIRLFEFYDSFERFYQFTGAIADVYYSSITDVQAENETINNFYLSQNYPNPFNPSTKIKYTIPSVGTQRAVSVQIKVYDVLGNEIETLVNEFKPAGSYEVEFPNAETGHAPSLPSGVYFYQLKTGNFVESRKMVLLR